MIKKVFYKFSFLFVQYVLVSYIDAVWLHCVTLKIFILFKKMAQINFNTTFEFSSDWDYQKMCKYWKKVLNSGVSWNTGELNTTFFILFYSFQCLIFFRGVLCLTSRHFMKCMYIFYLLMKKLRCCIKCWNSQCSFEQFVMLLYTVTAVQFTLPDYNALLIFIAFPRASSAIISRWLNRDCFHSITSLHPMKCIYLFIRLYVN